MVITTTKLTLVEYLNRSIQTEKHFELVAGSLSEMPQKAL